MEELDAIDRAILGAIAQEPGKPIRNAFCGLKTPEKTLYWRAKWLHLLGLIDLDSESWKGRKLASLTEKGREALA